MKKSILTALVCAGIIIPAVGQSEETTQLKEVVVTATKTEKDPQDVTQSVTVITADDIKQSSATNVAEVLRTVAGVSVNDQGARGGVLTLSIRGAQYAQALVLIDGNRLNSPRDGGFDLSALPVTLEDIERIEIVRGPSSALYGADAVAGVVNIITKKPQASRTTISGTAGSHGFDLLSAGNSGKHGGFSYLLSGQRETYDGYRKNSDLDQGTASAKIGYDFSDRSSIELSGNYTGKENGVPGSTAYPSDEARQWDRISVASLGYSFAVSKELGFKVRAYRNGDTLRYKDPAYSINSRHESITNGGEIQVNWLANSWNAITAGFEGKDDRLNSTDSGVHKTRLNAGFLQDEMSIGESLIVVLGGRIDSHSVYGDQVSPRVSARYLAKAGTIFRVSAGRSFRAPTFNDLYWFDPWFQGNPDLKPETAREYEAGVEQPFGKGNSVRISAFQRNVEDMIIWVYDTSPSTPKNIGKARIRGGEVEARFKLAEPLVWAFNYSYVNPYDEVKHERIYGLAENQIKSYLELALPTKTTLYVEGRAADYYTKPGEDTWRYSVFDAKLSQALSIGENQRADLFFMVKNLFNRNYAIARSYDFLTSEHNGGYPMPPREIQGGISFSF